MAYKINIVWDIPQGAETSSIPARFAPDAAEDVQGQSWRVKGLAEDEDTRPRLEGQVPRARRGEDAEGSVLQLHVLEVEKDRDSRLLLA